MAGHSNYYINGKIVNDVCCKNKPYYTTSYTCYETQTIRKNTSETVSLRTTAYTATTWLSRMSTYNRSTTINSTLTEPYNYSFRVTQKRVKEYKDITIECECECCCGCQSCGCVEPMSIEGGYVRTRIFDRYETQSNKPTTVTKSSNYYSYENVNTTYSSTTTTNTEFNKSRIYSSISVNPEFENAISSTSDNKLIQTSISSIIGFNYETVTTATSTTKTLYDTIHHETDEYHTAPWDERVITGYKSIELTKTSLITYPEPVETVSVNTIVSKSFYTEPKTIVSKYWTTSSRFETVWHTNILTSTRTVEIAGQTETMTVSYPKY